MPINQNVQNIGRERERERAIMAATAICFCCFYVQYIQQLAAFTHALLTVLCP